MTDHHTDRLPEHRPAPLIAGSGAAEADDRSDPRTAGSAAATKETAPAGVGPTADEGRIERRAADLLPEERAAGSDDPEAQAAAILADSDARTDGVVPAQTTTPLDGTR